MFTPSGSVRDKEAGGSFPTWLAEQFASLQNKMFSTLVFVFFLAYPMALMATHSWRKALMTTFILFQLFHVFLS